MMSYTKYRANIPNANNGRAYMLCIVMDKKMEEVYKIGYNKYETTLCHGTIHAEVDAVLKLPVKKKKTSINIAVFTTNKNGDILRMSKCCDNCLKSMNIICKKKKYIIHNIYYIDDKGEICKI